MNSVAPGLIHVAGLTETIVGFGVAAAVPDGAAAAGARICVGGGAGRPGCVWATALTTHANSTEPDDAPSSQRRISCCSHGKVIFPPPLPARFLSRLGNRPAPWPRPPHHRAARSEAAADRCPVRRDRR